MKQILIVGNSITGIKAAEEIRAADQESALALLSAEPGLPVRPDLWLDFLTKTVTEQKALYRPKDFYEKNLITILSEKKIERFSLRKNYVTSEEKEKIPYDILVITDSPDTAFPDIKGIGKSGVFGFRKFSQVKDVFNLLPFIETIAVQSNTSYGVQVANALCKTGKEVFFVAEKEQALDQGVRIFAQSSIEEILGEGEVMAVRLKSGKVLGCQMVVFPDAQPDFRKFYDSALEIDRRICVDSKLRTNLENIYACGEAFQLRSLALDDLIRFSVTALEEQGKVVAMNILGASSEYQPPAAIINESVENPTVVSAERQENL